jgi:hypothetical protein
MYKQDMTLNRTLRYATKKVMRRRYKVVATDRKGSKAFEAKCLTCITKHIYENKEYADLNHVVLVSSK